MKNKTPFLPGISTKLYGKQKRRQLEELSKSLHEALQDSISDYGVLFNHILPPDKLYNQSQDCRKRTYPEMVTFWAWVSQILECNGSCCKAVTIVQQWYTEVNNANSSANKLKIPSSGSSSYCRARQRLSNEFLDFVLEQVQDYTEARVRDSDLWNGLRLKAIDGSSTQLLDTEANQKEYPQPNTQKEGCGFPVMGFSGILDMAKGSISSLHLNKHTVSDVKAAHSMVDDLNENDLLIADRAYCSYGLISTLLNKGVQSVMRLHQGRERVLNWSQGIKLGKNSRLVTWKKGYRPHNSSLSKFEWDQLPKELAIRLVRFKSLSRDRNERYVYLATTLIDSELYDSDEISMLYDERWKIEVKFRDIKTTMQFEQLKVKSPEMAEKSMKMIQIVYNLVKAIQFDSIGGKDCLLDEISFKGTVDVITEFRSTFSGLLEKPRLKARALSDLEQRVAERILVIRPGRHEPRAIKKRPKSYQILTSHRHDFKEIPHRSKYKKTG